MDGHSVRANMRRKMESRMPPTALPGEDDEDDIDKYVDKTDPKVQMIMDYNRSMRARNQRELTLVPNRWGHDALTRVLRPELQERYNLGDNDAPGNFGNTGVYDGHERGTDNDDDEPISGYRKARSVTYSGTWPERQVGSGWSWTGHGNCLEAEAVPNSGGRRAYEAMQATYDSRVNTFQVRSTWKEDHPDLQYLQANPEVQLHKVVVPTPRSPRGPPGIPDLKTGSLYYPGPYEARLSPRSHRAYSPPVSPRVAAPSQPAVSSLLPPNSSPSLLGISTDPTFEVTPADVGIEPKGIHKVDQIMPAPYRVVLARQTARSRPVGSLTSHALRRAI